ncbi:hypothetical protein P3T73_14325 [Kiritimatiellota bacterium B12222]|nr:hypothetical protein P3T73_14325 [Kiritimatiellota bacterium B12222]
MKFLPFLFFTLFSFTLWADPAFEQGRSLYDQGEFEQALESYLQIPGFSANLDYNRANTLMRLGRTPEALAYYRRALWQKSSDPDIRANLQRASTQLEIILPPLPLYRRMAGFMTTKQWQWTLIISCWIFAGFGMLQYRIPQFKTAAAWVFPLAGLLILSSIAGTWATLPAHWTKEAIVMPEHVTARFEPLPDATEHFSIPQGTLVILGEKSRNWVRIRSGENQGWIPSDSVISLESL